MTSVVAALSRLELRFSLMQDKAERNARDCLEMQAAEFSHARRELFEQQSDEYRVEAKAWAKAREMLTEELACAQEKAIER